MWCPFCAYEKTRVIDTRKDTLTKRVRACERCGAVFRTVEKVEFKLGDDEKDYLLKNAKQLELYFEDN